MSNTKGKQGTIFADCWARSNVITGQRLDHCAAECN